MGVYDLIALIFSKLRKKEISLNTQVRYETFLTKVVNLSYLLRIHGFSIKKMISSIQRVKEEKDKINIDLNEDKILSMTATRNIPKKNIDELVHKQYVLYKQIRPIDQPQPDAVTLVKEIYLVNDQTSRKYSKASVFFTWFANYWTEMLFNTDPLDKTLTRNYCIYPRPVYGLTQNAQEYLRLGMQGKMVLENNLAPTLGYLLELKKCPPPDDIYPDYGGNTENINQLFCSGSKRGNIQIGNWVMHSLYLREHNRICDLILFNEPHLDDNAVFNIAHTALFYEILNMVRTEYISTLLGYDISSAAYKDVTFLYKVLRLDLKKYIPNIEYLYSYIWHGSIIDDFTYGNIKLNTDKSRYDLYKYYKNSFLEDFVIGSLTQKSFALTAPNNTPLFMEHAEVFLVNMLRENNVASFNDIRSQIGLSRYKHFSEITQNKQLAEKLKRLFLTTDNIDLYTGMICEEKKIRKKSPISITQSYLLSTLALGFIPKYHKELEEKLPTYLLDEFNRGYKDGHVNLFLKNNLDTKNFKIPDVGFNLNVKAKN